MGPVWIRHGVIYPGFAPNKERRESSRSLHNFLAHMRSELERANSIVFSVGMNLPMHGELTDHEDEESDESDDE